MSQSTPAIRISEPDTVVQEEKNPEDAVLVDRLRRIIKQVHDYAYRTRDILKVAGEEETRRLLTGLEHIKLTEEEITGWERMAEKLRTEHLASGIALREKMEAILDKACEDKHISSVSRNRWIYERFENPAISYKAREYFVNYQLPSYVQAWERVKRQRDLLAKNPATAKLTSSAVKDIEKFRSEDAFLSLHYDAKVSLVSEVQAAINAPEELHVEAKEMLASAVSAGVLSENMMGVWLRRIFSRRLSLSEQEALIRRTLKHSLIPKWTKERYRYDHLERQMEATELRGFQRMPPDTFLMLEDEQRKTYLEEAKRRLNIDENVERAQKSKLHDTKLRIRHNLDIEDWEGAELLIEEAEKVATDEDVYEIASMKRFLNAFRDQKGETLPMQDVTQTLEEMRAAFSEVPVPLRSLYFNALTIGYPTLESVCALAYNRIWCWENGFLDAKIEEELRSCAEEDTKKVLQEGHQKRGRENIDLDAVDDLRAPGAVRTYDRGEWGPTVIHYSSASCGKLLARVGENRGFAFNYWTTLVPKNVAFVEQQHLVCSVNPVLKRGLRLLRKHEVPFTLTGTHLKVAA